MVHVKYYLTSFFQHLEIIWPLLQDLDAGDWDTVCGDDPRQTVPLRHHHSPGLFLGGCRDSGARLSCSYSVSRSDTQPTGFCSTSSRKSQLISLTGSSLEQNHEWCIVKELEWIHWAELLMNLTRSIDISWIEMEAHSSPSLLPAISVQCRTIGQ